MSARTRFIARQDQQRAAAAERRLAQGRERRAAVEGGFWPGGRQRDPAGTPPVIVITRKRS